MSEIYREKPSKKVGIITFHGAHNYGSCLQAYALLNTINSMGYDAEIINFRTDNQKDQYSPLTKRKGVKYFLKNCYFFFHLKSRKKKYELFETFISQYLVMGQREYKTLEELECETFPYDYFICGSDQIWNTNPSDANDAYFLPFVKNSKVRIAYAPSFGAIKEIKKDSRIRGVSITV